MLCILKSVALAKQGRSFGAMTSFDAGGKAAADVLARIRVAPVTNGAISGERFEAGQIWADKPTMVYVVRRPG
jgi:hypothetical protein